MAEIKGTIDKRTDEIAQLEATVKSLDKAGAEATELRQADHKQLMSDDSNAKELLSFAKRAHHSEHGRHSHNRSTRWHCGHWYWRSTGSGVFAQGCTAAAT